MKDFKFISFDKFLAQKRDSEADKSPLFYSRLYGGGMWGFTISGFYDFEYTKGESNDIIQVGFQTFNIEYAMNNGALTVIPNREKHMKTFIGINKENFLEGCEWVKEQRKTLLDSVVNLTDMYNPMLDMKIETELISEERVDKEGVCE